MRTAEDNWGPWSDAITDTERLARVRSLRALIHARYGIDHDLTWALYRAENLRPEALDRALSLLNALPSLDRRKMMSLYQSMASMHLKDNHKSSARGLLRRKAS